MTDSLWLQVVYWVCVGCVVYTYAVYPARLAVWSKAWPKPVRQAGRGETLPTVSVVIAAHNEGHAIAGRVNEFTRRIVAAGLTGEVVVVSDGSTDATADEVRALADGPVPVTVVELV